MELFQPITKFTENQKRLAWIAGRVLCLALILALGSLPCEATIILVTLTREAIYLGADGRGTLIDVNGNETPCDFCKIRQFGKIVAAYSGTVIDADVKFNVFDVLSSIKADSVSDFADKLIAVLPGRFQESLGRSAQTRSMRPDLLMPGDIAIVGFEDGKPSYIRVLFINDKGVIKAIRKNDGKQFEKDLKLNPGIISGPSPIGEFNAVSFRDFASMDCGPGSDVETKTHCMLNAYITADPKHINKPIAIIKVTKDGISWIEKGKCEN